MSLRLSYAGNVKAGLANRVLGPDRHGAYYAVESTRYLKASDRTRATLRPVESQTMVGYDQFDQMFLVSD